MIKSLLTTVACLPDDNVRRLEAALAGLGTVIATADRADLLRTADRTLPDVIVMDPKHVLGSDTKPFDDDATVPGRLLVPLVAWWDVESLISSLNAVRHRSVAWIISDPAVSEQFLRQVVLQACSAVHQQLAIAIESRIELLPHLFARELRTAVSQPATLMGQSAWSNLAAVRPATLRRHLHRVSLASLDRFARISRIATAYRHLRFESSTASRAAREAGYASKRTMRDHVRQEFGCMTSELRLISSGGFVSRAAQALMHQVGGLDSTGT